MDQRTYDAVLRLWVAGSLVVGVGLIPVGSRLLTSVGIVLIVLGLVSLIPVVKNFMTDPDAA